MLITVRTLRLSLSVTAVFGMTNAEAFAYLDPGTGSFVIQALIAALAAAALTARYYWQKLSNFFRDPFNRKSSEKQEHDEPEPDDES